MAIEDPNTIRVATDRLGGKGLARSEEDDDPWKFGSWHAGVTLFALGDGAARAIPNKTDPAVLRLLSCRNDGQAVEMPGVYDEFSDRSYPYYPGGTSLQRWHRNLLRKAMEAEGFKVFEAEWWHFDYRDWKKYPILNLTFEQLMEQKGK